VLLAPRKTGFADLPASPSLGGHPAHPSPGLEERERRLQDGDGCAPYRSPIPTPNTDAHPRFDVGKVKEYKALLAESEKEVEQPLSPQPLSEPYPFAG
jgi:hypothetical protein